MNKNQALVLDHLYMVALEMARNGHRFGFVGGAAYFLLKMEMKLRTDDSSVRVRVPTDVNILVETYPSQPGRKYIPMTSKNLPFLKDTMFDHIDILVDNPTKKSKKQFPVRFIDIDGREFPIMSLTTLKKFEIIGAENGQTTAERNKHAKRLAEYESLTNNVMKNYNNNNTTKNTSNNDNRFGGRRLLF